MARVLSFHFHGYQPGDFLRRLPGDPFAPMAFEERRSPVAHRVAGARVEGRNWTDAVLRAYGRMEAVLDRVAASEAAASVDIEPHTLVMLLERDPDAYARIARAHARGAAALVLTPPFHPILPHHHATDRDLLFDIMFDFYAPWLRNVPSRPAGLWLPEAGFSVETLASLEHALRRAQADHPEVRDAGPWYVILDARQVERPSQGATDGILSLSGEAGIRALARHPEFSNEFAFGASDASHYADRARRAPEERVLVGSDLESLLANPGQASRFEAIVEEFRRDGRVSAPDPSGEAVAASVREFSTWSDYEEHLAGGRTGDTRWTGLRRSDGLVIHRIHRGRRMSQLWKHAFTQVTLRIEAAIRQEARRLLREVDRERPEQLLRRLVRSYARGLFAAHYRANGVDAGGFGNLANEVGGSHGNPEAMAYLARSYIEMLMALRSDPRFWDNPDTRVTFQGVAFLAQALEDMAEASKRAGHPERGLRLLRLLRATLLDFSESYDRGGFFALHGVGGWETTESAWLESLQSEVPHRSGHDVVRRACLYAAGETIRTMAPGEIPGPGDSVVGDTGHIVGEAHGEWENKAWCEHRPST